MFDGAMACPLDPGGFASGRCHAHYLHSGFDAQQSTAQCRCDARQRFETQRQSALGQP
jgi:hypothetical protein